MEKRLWYGITWPSAILTVIFGFWLVQAYNYWLQPWMLLKLGFVAGLLVYHFLCGALFNQLQKGIIKYSSLQLRIWNEVATLFLVAIIFVIVLKSTIAWIWGAVGLFLFALALMLAIKLYKISRESSSKQ